ncbi:MAG: YfiT family bacillithiol transferase [Gemmatimonadota bacterium]
MTAPDLRYPIGRYTAPPVYTPAWRAICLDALAAAAAELRSALAGLTEAQLDTPYRPGGWTVRQVAHHVPDSHLNAYVRLKWTLTEDRPLIKAYDEGSWAALEDSRTTPIDVSLALLESVQDRFVRLLRALPDETFERRYVHPETGEHPVDHLVGLYAWHGRHHTAHVTSLRARSGF